MERAACTFGTRIISKSLKILSNHFYSQMKKTVPAPEKMHLLGPMFLKQAFVSVTVISITAMLSKQYCHFTSTELSY